MRDAVDEINRKLGEIAAGLDQMSGGTTTVHQDIDIQRDPADPVEARYFSTGPDAYSVDNTSFVEVTFGFVAREVNVRSTDDIDIAFENPRNKQSAVIPLDGSETPFSMGGAPPIQASSVWVRQGDTAETTPAVHILAY